MHSEKVICDHLTNLVNTGQSNIICLICANGRVKLEGDYCEESLELVNAPSKSKFYIAILFAVSILVVAGLYIHAIIVTDEYISTLILAKKITNQVVLFPQIQILFTIGLICSAILSGYLCFSDDYSNKMRGWVIVAIDFLTVCVFNLFIIFDQWINKYQ